MIIVITTKDERGRIIASHGIDMDSGHNVVLPCDPPETLGARFHAGLGEWVLADGEGR